MVLRNAGSGKCLVAKDDADFFATVQTETCNAAEKKQQFVMFDDKDKIKTSGGSCVVVTRRQDLALAWNRHDHVSLVGCGDSNNSMRDRKPSMKTVHPYKDAPFFLQAFDVTEKAFTDDEGVIKYNDVSQSNTKQMWVPEIMALKCDAAKIVTSECSLKRLCATNPEDTICKEFCADKANRPVCDTWVTDYCGKNLTNRDFCGCINVGNQPAGIAKEKWQSISGRPECHVQRCAANANAYLLERHMYKERCPSDVYCIVNVGAGDNSDISMDNAIVNQNCSSTSNNVNSSTSTSTSTSTATTEVQYSGFINNFSQSLSISPNALYIGLWTAGGVIALILIILIVYVSLAVRRRIKRHRLHRR